MNRPKIGMIGDRRVFGVEPLRRRVQQTEPFAGHARDDLGLGVLGEIRVQQ